MQLQVSLLGENLSLSLVLLQPILFLSILADDVMWDEKGKYGDAGESVLFTISQSAE